MLHEDEQGTVARRYANAPAPFPYQSPFGLPFGPRFRRDRISAVSPVRNAIYRVGEGQYRFNVGSDRGMQKADGLSKLIAAHRQALNAAEALGARLMNANDEEALLTGQSLDAAFAAEAVARRKVAAAPVETLRDVKLKAAYFKRLLGKDWGEVEPGDIRALLRSFANIPA